MTVFDATITLLIEAGGNRVFLAVAWRGTSSRGHGAPGSRLEDKGSVEGLSIFTDRTIVSFSKNLDYIRTRPLNLTPSVAVKPKDSPIPL